MTGFASVAQTFNDYQIQCEMKCLNSRAIELTLNLPQYLNDKEIEIRNVLTQKLERGKIYFNLSIEFASTHSLTEFTIDEHTAVGYWNAIQKLAHRLNIPVTERSFVHLLQMPEIWKKNNSTDVPQLWQNILNVIHQTIEQVLAFRTQEGKNIAKFLKESVKKIQSLTMEIEKYELNRIPAMKDKLLQILKEYSVNLNEDRLMQELVYYAEKYDITEEKTRLLHHCQYFVESLESPQNNGKKLQFIAQEMHREANTLGVKSNHIEIQKIVVRIKEEIEKIKEQLNNVA
ncbi:MAG: YicC family protein [Bacteroidia bacterium]|nr:YicC family protein [Bacteroidia bacterium]